jgi:hypothetical protein
MFRIIAIGSIIVLPFLLTAEGAIAQRPAAKMSATGGQCPVGTCGKTGQPYAKNIKLCSAANCKNGGPK